MTITTDTLCTPTSTTDDLMSLAEQYALQESGALSTLISMATDLTVYIARDVLSASRAVTVGVLRLPLRILNAL